eukprot:CAMPEP_0177471860 /NCGR_PEP_ID=MMETSP0369-20130122/20987_1 /TAXON_ID=447022 ORGANISM="Scrippsiella hangoei-like, Strain SHHI-4" /NCGR_SAMPLE_ID=MMETSP0369 /ASSEMBLY_ACC=CAM_ASM_000364 /LENGTH=344 /DNA_ID=CAMNT_0018946469 /DNA_START=51 /DNA_END=1083 /DNA_ORIENTATION=+
MAASEDEAEIDALGIDVVDEAAEKEEDGAAENEDEDEEEDEEDAEGDEEVDEDDVEDEDDAAFDFEAIAELGVQAAEASQKRRRRHKEHDLSLDVGLGAEHLYMTPGSTGTRAFDTTAPPGISRLDLADFQGGAEPDDLPPLSGQRRREVRGAAVRPVDDKSLKKKEGKKDREARLEKWFGMRKRVLTPEMEAELKAIKLRANYDPKRFYKAHDSKELPKYFTFATEVGGGLAAAGLHTRAQEVHAHSGRSLLSEIMRDDKAQEWTRKRSFEVASRSHASFKSGHGTARSRKDKAKGTHRGGAWKGKKKDSRAVPPALSVGCPRIARGRCCTVLAVMPRGAVGS